MTKSLGYCSSGLHNREGDSNSKGGGVMLTRVGKRYCPIVVSFIQRVRLGFPDSLNLTKCTFQMK